MAIGRDRMDMKSYNNMRRKQALTRQKNHGENMIRNAEQRLKRLRSRQSSIESQLRNLENVR